jgi:hypothetical protein
MTIGLRRSALAAVAVAALALPLAGCGKDKPKIPRADARSLVALLGTAERQSDAHACVTVTSTISSLQTRVAALPAKTDPDIRASLRDGIAHLRELVAAECSLEKQKPKKEKTTDSSDTTPETTSDTTTDTTTDTTDTTTDTTSDTTSTPSTSTTPPPPPSGGTPSDEGKGKGPGKKKGKTK